MPPTPTQRSSRASRLAAKYGAACLRWSYSSKLGRRCRPTSPCSSGESRAHPEYKRRLLGAEETILTELFGLGWPAPHRVIANAATDLGGEPLPPLAATDDGPSELVDTGPLYAGETVKRITELGPAADIVADLTP